MWYLARLGAYLLVPFAVVWFLQRMLTASLHSQSEKRLGCQRAPIRINKRLGGIDHIARLLRADRKGQVPTEYLKIYKEQKDHTYEQTILGTKQIMTIDPLNIQAILAIQFHDFEIGSIRRDNFAPLLGGGIFTADGKFWYVGRRRDVSLRHDTLCDTLTSEKGTFSRASSTAICSCAGRRP